MKISFHGAARTVTGTKHLLTMKDGTQILLDCGLFQGLGVNTHALNTDFQFDPNSVSFVLLSHAHIDHSGLLPKLVKDGFKGAIYCTPATRELTEILLIDSAEIQQHDADLFNKKNPDLSPREPLYTLENVQATFLLFKEIPYDESFSLTGDIDVRFQNTGHLIGSASIHLAVREAEKTISLLFSGDVGRYRSMLLQSPSAFPSADYIILESTYGNRLHPDLDAKKELENYINTTIEHKGTVIIPGFAVERAQSIMYLIWQLKTEGRIPNVPYILDTPMGASVLDIFLQNMQWHKLSANDCHEMCKMFKIVSEYEQTMRIIEDPQPKVIIAASGMATGGRILSYFEHYIGLEKTTVIMVGYQAEGTRGRRLLEGADEIKIYGNYYNVEAKIVQIEGLSAHGDQQDLVNWLSALKNVPKCIYLVHGENFPADELRIKIQDRYGFNCNVPLIGSEIEI